MAALPRQPWPAAVAVSGGADSLALCWLLTAWAKQKGLALPTVLSVDHGLGAGSEDIARKVVETARQWQLAAYVLPWTGPKPRRNLEAAARDARYQLLGNWCRSHGIKGLYVGHTLEDQAETLLLRLGRGSGVDGLCAMSSLSPFPLAGYPELDLVRPLLVLARASLRSLLEEQGLAWHEDPMNADPRFSRVRIRQAWPALIAAGLAPERLVLAADHLRRARSALQSAAEAFVAAHCHFDDDHAQLDRAALAALPEEIGLRALALVLMRVSGSSYRPRFRRLQALYNSVCRGELGGGRTLLGCRLAPVPRARRRFGEASLGVRGEAPRRSPAGAFAGVKKMEGAKGGSSPSDMED
jgi:tRNA(Ile)-lysidine synthase